MDSLQVAALRRLVTSSVPDDAIVNFASTLQAAPQPPGGLLVVGTPTFEPWHFVAHLAEEASAAGRAELAPTWVRWRPPANGPRQVAVGTDRLRDVDRHETILAIVNDAPPERLLDLVADGHKRGALVLALDRSNPDLLDIADEVLTVPLSAPPSTFEVVQHVITEIGPRRRSGRRHIRSRLRALLDR